MTETVKPPAIGPRLREMRKARKLTLEALARQAGVSRSLLSEIERGEANPTYGTLWTLTRTLGIDFEHLVDGARENAPLAIDRQSANLTPEIRSGDGTCRLKILSPPGMVSLVEWYMLSFELQGSLVSDPHEAGTHEHLHCLAGRLKVRSAEAEALLEPGDTARYRADVPHAIESYGDIPAEAFLVVTCARLGLAGQNG